MTTEFGADMMWLHVGLRGSPRFQPSGMSFAVEVLRNLPSHFGAPIMESLFVTPLVAAAGYSLVYLLAGGGIFGAGVIFVVAKLLGR